MEERERNVAKPNNPEHEDREAASATLSSTQPACEYTAILNRDTEEEDESVKLDICSDDFDPVLALYSPTVPLPFPNIKCFNNVAEYESFLKGGRGRAKPENVEKRQRKAMKGVVDPERIARLKKLMVHNTTPGEETGSTPLRMRRQQRAPKNVVTRMALCKGSPLGELYRCVEERIRIKVHIRTFKGLRGVCSGFVIAFDKFWNLAMVDVDETYREPLLGEAFYHEKALTVTRLFEKLKLQDSSEITETPGMRKGKGNKSQLQPEPSRPSSTGLPPLGKEGGSKHGDGGADTRTARNTDQVTNTRVTETGSRPRGKDHPYGRVHTRHLNQLFIRGENVLLVNIQAL